MTVLTIWLGVGIGNYAHFTLKGHSILFRRKPELPPGNWVPYRGARRREVGAGLLEAVFFIVLWPVQLGWWVARVLNEKIFDPIRAWIWGAGK